MKSPNVVKVEVSEEVFKEYYYKYRNLIYLVISKYKLDPFVAEDVALYMFCKIPSLIQKFDSSRGKFTTYITLVTRTVILHALKEGDFHTLNSTEFNFDFDNLVDETTLPAPYNFTMKFVERLLNEEEYELIFTVFVMNKTIKQYAKEKNVCYSTMKKRYTVCLAKLRRLTEDYFK